MNHRALAAGFVGFRGEPGARARRPRSRQGLWSYATSGDARTMVTAPVIYSVVLPLLLLDAWISAYQAICFRAWGIDRVRRRRYFVFDRHKLAYLNGIEKVHCAFCSYANGVFAFGREVAARTEQYWCPIRHARRPRGSHARAVHFADYGDALAYERSLPRLRGRLHGRR